MEENVNQKPNIVSIWKNVWEYRKVVKWAFWWFWYILRHPECVKEQDKQQQLIKDTKKYLAGMYRSCKDDTELFYPTVSKFRKANK